MPHYGVSGPGNLDKSPARTLQDARDAIHDVVVNQLGVHPAIAGRPVIVKAVLERNEALRLCIIQC